MPDLVRISGELVKFATFAEGEVSYAGEEVESFWNTRLSSRSHPKRNWTGVTIPYTVSEMAIVRAIIGNGSVGLACTGTGFQGLTPTCYVKITSMPYQRDQRAADGYKVEYTFEFRQV